MNSNEHRRIYEEHRVRDTANRETLLRLRDLLSEALGAHDDNCGTSCFPNLAGHHCCSICNHGEIVADAVKKLRNAWGEPIL